MALPLNENTWREKLLREQIRDPAYSAWLIENIDEITSSAWIDLALHSTVPLAEKIEYLRLMKQSEMFNTTDAKLKDWKEFIHEKLDDCLNVLTKAFDLINPETQPADTMFLRTSKWHDRDDGFLCYRECSEVHRTFQQVLDAIRVEYADDCDYDLSKLPADFHPDEFTWLWNKVTCYQLQDGEYKELMQYIVSEDGNIWNVSLPIDITGHRRIRFHDYSDEMGSLYLPTPFMPGDILTVDCRPFHEPAHAVVIYTHNPGFDYDCCAPGCLGMVDGKWTLHSVKHYFCGNEEFSPLLHIGIYEGELPEEETLIADVSRFIKANPGGAEMIDKTHYHEWNECSAEGIARLYKLMEEYEKHGGKGKE